MISGTSFSRQPCQIKAKIEFSAIIEKTHEFGNETILENY